MTTTTNTNVTKGNFDIFTNYDGHTISNLDVTKMRTFFDNMPVGDKKLKVTSADVKLFDVDGGEQIANIDVIQNKCHGLSVWVTKKDLGVRFTQKYLDMFSQSPICKCYLDNIKVYKFIKRDKERRYAFYSIDSLVRFLTDLFDYYNAYMESTATKVIETAESVIA